MTQQDFMRGMGQYTGYDFGGQAVPKQPQQQPMQPQAPQPTNQQPQQPGMGLGPINLQLPQISAQNMSNFITNPLQKLFRFGNRDQAPAWQGPVQQPDQMDSPMPYQGGGGLYRG